MRLIIRHTFRGGIHYTANPRYNMGAWATVTDDFGNLAKIPRGEANVSLAP